MLGKPHDNKFLKHSKSLYIVFIILGNISTAQGQRGIVDTAKLPKYSYLIYGYSPLGSSVQATGFFVNKRKYKKIKKRVKKEKDIKYFTEITDNCSIFSFIYYRAPLYLD